MCGSQRAPPPSAAGAGSSAARSARTGLPPTPHAARPQGGAEDQEVFLQDRIQHIKGSTPRGNAPPVGGDHAVAISSEPGGQSGQRDLAQLLKRVISAGKGRQDRPSPLPQQPRTFRHLHLVGIVHPDPRPLDRPHAGHPRQSRIIQRRVREGRLRDRGHSSGAARDRRSSAPFIRRSSSTMRSITRTGATSSAGGV
ncbi:hypothetical protein JSE7799_02401 [Jannaschia seosinensis]|uniref:Uncharacterized protein n=1 Tax=Jannaschia seosinensis TaxID=313367 RepID=A0A0M7BCX7_9RHOB|nr:hypothetical protein JSE7799_02401 [Jannaschia seosinensis]